MYTAGKLNTCRVPGISSVGALGTQSGRTSVGPYKPAWDPAMGAVGAVVAIQRGCTWPCRTCRICLGRHSRRSGRKCRGCRRGEAWNCYRICLIHE